MKIQKMKIPAILGALLLAGTLSAGAQMNSDSLYKEPYRPQYHFSPEKGWIGDPSGFMYYQGKYHMYWWGKLHRFCGHRQEQHGRLRQGGLCGGLHRF